MVGGREYIGVSQEEHTDRDRPSFENEDDTHFIDGWFSLVNPESLSRASAEWVEPRRLNHSTVNAWSVALKRVLFPPWLSGYCTFDAPSGFTKKEDEHRMERICSTFLPSVFPFTRCSCPGA